MVRVFREAVSGSCFLKATSFILAFFAVWLVSRAGGKKDCWWDSFWWCGQRWGSSWGCARVNLQPGEVTFMCLLVTLCSPLACGLRRLKGKSGQYRTDHTWMHSSWCWADYLWFKWPACGHIKNLTGAHSCSHWFSQTHWFLHCMRGLDGNESGNLC